MVVMKKEQYMMCDIANCHACELLCVGLSHARLTVCVCVDYLLVCRPSPFGECDELHISSISCHQFQCVAKFRRPSFADVNQNR